MHKLSTREERKTRIIGVKMAILSEIINENMHCKGGKIGVNWDSLRSQGNLNFSRGKV